VVKSFARGNAESVNISEESQLPVASGTGGYFAGHLALARFSVEMARQHYREALTQAKLALLNFQSAKDIQGESAANRALGLYFLKNEQVYDAMDYFANASQTAEQNDDFYELFMSQYYEALTFFIFGNYSRSRRLLRRALELAPRLFRPDLEAQAIFLLGRVAYEIGDYEESAACLERALCVTDRTANLDEASKRLRIWLARSLAKIGSGTEALASLSAFPQDSEALLFSSEIRLARGDAEGALKAAEGSLALFKPDTAYYTENPRFQSGYELAENICLLAQNNSDALRVQILATLSEIHRACGNQQKAMEILYDVTRGMGVSENNPAIHYYYFAYFHAISEAQKVDEVYYQDKGTVLSKAFKYLQLRASRIDTAEDKASYMTNNPENKRLLEIARSFKFI
jgi:tetratricopeptide (TPR) repeat protein